MSPDDEDRVADAELLAILRDAPPTPVGVFLRALLGVDRRRPFKQLGTVRGFCRHTGQQPDALRAVLDGRELLSPQLAAQLEDYFGLADKGVLLRVQQSAHLDRVVKH